MDVIVWSVDSLMAWIILLQLIHRLATEVFSLPPPVKAIVEFVVALAACYALIVSLEPTKALPCLCPVPVKASTA